MDILLSHRSALEYWCLNGMAKVDPKHRQRRRTPPIVPPSDSVLKGLDTRGVLYPVEAMVGKPDAMTHAKIVQ